MWLLPLPPRTIATHYCVKARGVQDPTSSTTTTALGGHFKLNPSSRHEFLTDD